MTTTSTETKFEIQPVPIEQGWFMANGHKYIIEKRYSASRFNMLQRFQLEAGFGVTFEEMLKAWEKVNGYANRMLFTDIAVMAYNMVNGVRRVAEREPVLLKMCALFINRETEDRRTITDDQITEKIRDWQEAGYDVNDFFMLAVNTIRGFIENYQRVTQAISELTEVTNTKKSN
jgi:hypothetical protein